MKTNELSENFSRLSNSTHKYLRQPSHMNPLTYLVAKRGQNIYTNTKVAPEPNGAKILETLVQNYINELEEIISEFGIFDWNSDSPQDCILIKKFDNRQREFYNNLSASKDFNNESFLKKSYPIRFFSIELPINASQSVHLHQHISSTWQTKFKAYFPIFENIKKIQMIDYTKGFMISHDFDFLSFTDKTNPKQCFSIIKFRKSFEKLYEYVELYKRAYEEVSSLDCIDLKILGQGSEDCWRKCALLLKFPNLKHCMSALNEELLNDKQTISKDILNEKKITYKIRNGRPVIIPKNARQLKVVIKMLNDKIVRTQYLQRSGLSDYIEEI